MRRFIAAFHASESGAGAPQSKGAPLCPQRRSCSSTLPLHEARGFTLVEIVVVLAIIGVLAGMAAPRLAARAGGANLREAARDLLVTARYARDWAASHRRPARLRFDKQSNAYALEVRQKSRTGEVEFGPVSTGAEARIELPAGVRLGRLRVQPWHGEDWEDAAAESLTFRPDGQCDAGGIELTDGRRTWTVVVFRGSGHARLETEGLHELPDQRIDLDLQQ